MSSNQLRVKAISQRTRARKCVKCGENMIKVGGYEYDNKLGSSVSFIVGRICKRDNILYLDPKLEGIEIIFHKIGGNSEKKDL